MNFAKFLRTPFLQITSARLVLNWNKTKCLLLSRIAFLSLSDINKTLKIGITITWSFLLRYVSLEYHYDAGKTQSQYVIGLYRDVNPTKNRCRNNISCPVGYPPTPWIPLEYGRINDSPWWDWKSFCKASLELVLVMLKSFSI